MRSQCKCCRAVVRFRRPVKILDLLVQWSRKTPWSVAKCGSSDAVTLDPNTCSIDTYLLSVL